MRLRITEIENYLGDGREHSVEELVEEFGVSEESLRDLLRFLECFGFLVMKDDKVTLSEWFIDLPT